MNISVVFLLLALVAEVFGTIGGFGSSVFFVPVANFYFDFHSVLGLTAVFHLSSNVSKIALFKSGLNKELLFSIGIPSVIFVILGGFLSKYFDSTYLEISLAIFLIALSSLFLIKIFSLLYSDALGGYEASRQNWRRYNGSDFCSIHPVTKKDYVQSLMLYIAIKLELYAQRLKLESHIYTYEIKYS